jgi:hypothetical protein
VKNILIVISFLISMVITIAHDAINHHHGITENIEFISDSNSDDLGHDDSDHHHKDHCPPHQHIISEGNFITGRNTVSLSKVPIDSHQDTGTGSILIINLFDNKYVTGFVRLIKKPRSSFPFIISLNYTRGSPFLS